MYPFFVPGNAPPITLDKGEQIMNGLLLNQYQNSPRLKEYMMCFLEEFNLLFEQVERIYYGYTLENATHHQLDVLGIILNQSRAIELPTLWFGFQGALDVDGMSDEATPSNGGIFRSEESVGFEVTPLEDAVYRRLLLTRAYLMNKDTCSIEEAYTAISLLLGKVPSLFHLESIGHRQVQLNLSSTYITLAEVQLILYISKFLIPAGVTFTIIRT